MLATLTAARGQFPPSLPHGRTTLATMIVVAFSTQAMLVHAVAAQSPARPNIVLVMADDV